MKYFLYVIGGHYGDEAKGKITDILAPHFDVVIRGSGGANAGHTIISNGKKIALHLLPAGVLHKEILSVLGAEMMVDTSALENELEESKRWNTSPKIMISAKANIVMDWHKAFDGASEKTGQKIGTTKRGIGPAAETKYSRRWAVTMGDVLSKELDKKIHRIVSELRVRLVEQHDIFSEFREMKLSEIIDADENSELGKALKKYADEQTVALRKIAKSFGNLIVEDVGEVISQEKYKRVLGEGAQGTMLDPTFGNLPYTTSTPTTAQGLSRGMQLEPKSKDVIGVFKAYETRVGEGPFPTEIPGKLGEDLQKKGGEFGATTGRGRRCGWFNLYEAQYAVRVNGLSWIAITKLDVLDELDEIKVGIKPKGDSIEYKIFKGWKTDTTKCRDFDFLPKEAKEYLLWLEKQLVPLAIVSVGPERNETIFVDSFKKHLEEAGVRL